MGTANEGRREIANGAPQTPPITEHSSSPTIQEPEPEPELVSEAPDPADDGPPSGYEQLRERRIKENLERMQKLGIFHLSAKLGNSSSTPPVKRPWRRQPRSEASRHSSRLENVKLGVRLENVVALSYNPRERLRLPWLRFPKDDLPKANVQKAKLTKAKQPKAKRSKKEAKWRTGGSVLRVKGRKAGPEIYTEEDEKLLGSTELSWKLYVDGHGPDGRRVYDPVNGKTCHQCRQKTLGHRTHCCKCQMVQGQFCGDCLYMRYGEHVLEANKNPDWVCPVCRGICNCSLCRNAKGWPPTGLMYKKIAKSGYKSVAHYLIQTKRAPPETESEDKFDKTTTTHSAKRSLTFKDMEVPADGKELFKDMEVPADGKELDCRDEKGVAESGISPNCIKEEAVVFSSAPNAGLGNSCEKQNRDARGRFKATGEAGENAGLGNSCGKQNRDAGGRFKATGKAGENEGISSDKKLTQEPVSQAIDKATDKADENDEAISTDKKLGQETVSPIEANTGFVASEAGNSCKKPNHASGETLKTTDKAGEDEDISSGKKLAQEAVSEATEKAVSSSKPNAGFVSSRTRNSCKKADRDASEGLKLETTDQAGENEVIKGCATKSCRKAKRSASPNAIQDSIARRLRPRINRT